MIDIDEFTDLMDEIAETEVPEIFYKDLNGGIMILPQVKISPYAKADDMYVLGTYNRGAMGRHIEIYYGSFAKLFPHLSKEQLREQMTEVLLHEFTHHIESLAGEKGLEKKDEEQLRKYLRK